MSEEEVAVSCRSACDVSDRIPLRLVSFAKTIVPILMVIAFCSSTLASAGAREMALRRVSLELPGAPAEIIPADLNGDGRVDLFVAVARTTWGEIGTDRIQGMVQITEVVPALFDRREAYAFLQSSDGSYHSAGAPLALPDSVLSLEAGPPGLPVIALTDVGLSVIRVAGESGGASLTLTPVLVDRPVLAGSRSLVSHLGMVQDLDGDGTRDVIVPALDGLALHRSTGGGLSERAASRVRLPGDEKRSGAAPFRRYPLPRIGDLDGDHLPDMLVLDTRSGERVVSVVRGAGEGRFREALRVETQSFLSPQPQVSTAGGEEARPEAARKGKGLPSQAERELAFFGDLDGDGRSEAVFTSEIDTGKSDLKKAKEPEYLYRFHHVGKDLVIDPKPYRELTALGHGFTLDLGDSRTSQFQDLDGDGRKDLVTVTLDFSLFQVLRVLATKRIGIGLDFHVWSQGPDGHFVPVRGLDLSETLRMDLNDLKLERLAQFAGDFDGDGRADFVHLGRGKKVTIHRGQPGCSYSAKPDLTIPLEEEPLDVGLVRVADLDGDGRADLGITCPLAPDDEGVSNPVRLDLYLSGGAAPMDPAQQAQLAGSRDSGRNGRTRAATPPADRVARKPRVKITVAPAEGAVNPSGAVKPAAAAAPRDRECTVSMDHSGGGVTRVEVNVPGRIIGHALPRRRGGGRDAVLLVDPAAAGASSPAGAAGVRRGTRVSVGLGTGGVSVDAADGTGAGAGAGAGASAVAGAVAGASAAGRDSRRGERASSPDRATGDAALWLVRVDPSGAGRIVVVSRALPEDVRGIDTIDLDGDGADEIVLWRPGGLYALHADAHRASDTWVSETVGSALSTDARQHPPTRADGDRLTDSPGPGQPRPSRTEDGRAGAGEGGGRRALDPAAALEALVDDPDIEPGPGSDASLCGLECGESRRIWTSVVGSLRGYGPSPEGGGWGIVSQFPLPVRTSRKAATLFLDSPVVRSIPRDSGGAQLFAVGPEAHGRDRLQTLLIDPAQPPGEMTTECWSLLPGFEKIIESAFLRIDGRPALAVTTHAGDKLGLFSEKRLRVFFLEADRTRRGLPPALAIETRINLWQRTKPIALDVDRDGRQDLVLGYWKGLKNDHFVLDAYLRNADGTFGRSPRTTTFEVKKADRSFLDYGHDLDGDGLRDLVILADDGLKVHPGSPAARKGEDLVVKAPRWSFPLLPEGAIHVNIPPQGDGASGDDEDGPAVVGDDAEDGRPARGRAGGAPYGHPRFVDMDGDGREDIVVANPSITGAGRFLIYEFPRSAPGS